MTPEVNKDYISISDISEYPGHKGEYLITAQYKDPKYPLVTVMLRRNEDDEVFLYSASIGSMEITDQFLKMFNIDREHKLSPEMVDSLKTVIEQEVNK